MNENLTKICRICLTEGSRHIFQKTVARDALYNVSSLNRISEKLRYVTLLKIDEMENLPPMICDLCIVQLNVAYNFKRQATESDTKLRQYLIENGIDIMKDPRAIPSTRGTTSQATTTLAITTGRSQRRNSVSSSSVLEVPTNGNVTSNGRSLEGRLVPIRIKVETPDTVEPSSDAGDLLSNSTISPLSVVTSPTAAMPASESAVGASAGKTNTTTTAHIVVDSSPSSSKGSLVSSGRDSAMVVVNSQNVNMQRDEDYVQNILGSNSSIATCISNSAEVNGAKQQNDEKKSESQEVKKSTSDSKDEKEFVREKRLKSLLSSLSINMVANARFPKSKLRIKARKKQQKIKLGIQRKTDTVSKNRDLPRSIFKRRHSPDTRQIAERLKNKKIKNDQQEMVGSSSKNRLIKRNPTLISANKLRSLREKIREEKEKEKHNNKQASEADAKRRKATTADAITRPRSSLILPGDKARVSTS